jgi:hypothetical protein
MDELNPNHPVTRELREQWYKLCAILLWKSGATEVQITSDDIDGFMKSGLANITMHPKDDVITLGLVSDAETVRLSRKEGGLPI